MDTYSPDAKKFLELANHFRENATAGLRANAVLQDLASLSPSVIGQDLAVVTDQVLLQGNLSGDEAHAGFMSIDGIPSEVRLLWCATAYAMEAIRKDETGHVAAAWHCAFDAGQMAATLTGLLAGRGDAEALRIVSETTYRAQVAGGRKGGEAEKKKAWAVELARQARARWPGYSKEDLWASLRDDGEVEVDCGGVDGQSFDCSIHGDTLHAVRCGDGATDQLKKASFFKRYLKAEDT
ncbi:hypothetical protein [Delftia acidovorans]|uniref:hypothetical protein n=1 Tax=Delftia acidovorans TaxID=80866 RepID=UPI0033412924